MVFSPSVENGPEKASIGTRLDALKFDYGFYALAWLTVINDSYLFIVIGVIAWNICRMFATIAHTVLKL